MDHLIKMYPGMVKDRYDQTAELRNSVWDTEPQRCQGKTHHYWIYSKVKTLDFCEWPKQEIK